jgi:hypothetical protein
MRIGGVAFGWMVLAGCFNSVAVKAPTGEKLQVSAGKFPHEVLDGVLKRVVNDQGRVDYDALAADRSELERYLVAVAEASPRTRPELFPTKEEKLAYWINGYNAYVLYAVTERPTMKSVNDDKTSFFYFTEYKFGEESGTPFVQSLYKLENEIVRPEFMEPRTHFALNCASAGCPELPPEAFMPDRLEEQLAREAKEFCAHPDKVKVNGNEVMMSQIFEWYGDDFKAAGGPVEFCRAWGRSDMPAAADAKLSFIPYDWALNAQPGKALFE